MHYSYLQVPSNGYLNSRNVIKAPHHHLIKMKALRERGNTPVKNCEIQSDELLSKEEGSRDVLKYMTINSLRFLMEGIFLSLAFTYTYHPEYPLLRRSVAIADSTGKYSTKATAKKRYLPRLKKAVVEFKYLGDSIENGKDFSIASQSYQERIENSYGTALSLYGSSTRTGEYLDDQSREVQDTLKQFVSDSKSLSRITDKTEAKQVYNKMKEELEQFLVLCKLEGNIEAEYYTQETPSPSTPVL